MSEERTPFLCGGYCTAETGPGGKRCVCARGDAQARPEPSPDAASEAWSDLPEPSAQRLRSRAHTFNKAAREIERNAERSERQGFFGDAADYRAAVSLIWKQVAALEAEAVRRGKGEAA